MFNIGGGEFLVIALIALIVLGPTRLPEAARQVGKAMGELRRLSSGFQNEIKTALDAPATTDAPQSPARDVLGAGPSSGDSAPPARPRRTAPLKAAPEGNGAAPAKRTKA